MSAKSDKKRDDKYAKQQRARQDALARHEADRTNSYSNRLTNKDKAEALELFTGAKTDLGTAKAGVDSVLARVAQDRTAQYAKDRASLAQSGASTASQLQGITDSNNAAANTYLSRYGLSGTGSAKSTRSNQFNQMINDLQTQYALQNLKQRESDANAIGADQSLANSLSNAQFVKDFTNQYNQSYNDANRQLSDSYDKTNFDLIGTLNQNNASLQDTLAQNNLNYQKAREYERAAAASRIRGGSGYYGYGTNSGLGRTSVGSPRPTTVKAPTIAEKATALNNTRISDKTKGGYWWSSKTGNANGTWNQTIN